jgi:DNA mismatch repair protein MutS
MPATPRTTDKTRSIENSARQSDFFLLDAHTAKDLEVFWSEVEGMSLFEFCNLSRTPGGAKALRRRMKQPWSSSKRIHATQRSLAFILDHAAAFKELPSAYTTSRSEDYLQELLPVVPHDNSVAFALGALSMRANNASHYSGIVRGVQISCGLIRTLRRLVGQQELASPAGELAVIFDEMRTLLSRPDIIKIPAKKAGSWVWSILRHDQIFRWHEKDTMNRLLELVYEVDALRAMAEVGARNGFVLPVIEKGPQRVLAEGLVHPFVKSAVANPVKLDQERRVLFLTGPNMAGKTTYLRAFGTALYFAHLGMAVPAHSMSFVPTQQLFSSISLTDDLHAGISYFRAEALRVKAIAQAIAQGLRVVAIMDEPFKGTNVKDALDASQAILERFATRKDCLFMFSSHLIELSENLSNTSQISYSHFKADESGGRLRFDYRLHPGVSSQRLGVRVLREEGVFELLERSQD